MNRAIVIAPDQRLRHVVQYSIFLDGTIHAACGKNPWPAQWTAAKGTELPLCMGCVNAIRNGR